MNNYEESPSLFGNDVTCLAKPPKDRPLVKSLISINLCTCCPLRGNPRVNGSGSINSEIVIVGGQPTLLDLSPSTLLKDRGRIYLNSVLKVCGISEEDCFFVTACRCRADSGVLDRDAVLFCRERLLNTLYKINPKIIVSLGEGTFFSLFPGFKKTDKVQKHRGRFLDCPDIDAKVMITHAPSEVRSDRYKEQPFREDMRKVADLLNGKIDFSVENKYEFIADLTVLKTKLRELKEVGLFSFDIETTNKRKQYDCFTENILSCAFSSKDKEGFCFLTDKHPENTWKTEEWWEILKELKVLFEDPLNKVIVHNEAFEASFLSKQFGIECSVYADTLLMHFLLDENSSHGLKILVNNYFPELAGYDEGIDKSNMEVLPVSELAVYNTTDADTTRRLYFILLKKLQENGFEDLFFNFIMPFRRVLTKMEMVGVTIDEERLQKTKKEFEEELAKTQQKIFEVAKKPLNLNSTLQVSKLLYEDLGLSTDIKTEGGKDSTGEEALKELASKHEIPKLMLLYRRLEHMISTYLEGFEKHINPVTHKIHTDFLVHGTRTGRISSQNPNLQNIPRVDDEADDEYGKAIRNLFVPRDIGWKLIEADYRQMEYRIILSHVKDEGLINSIKGGGDPHRETASEVFKVPQDQVTAKQRKIAKGIVFGLTYGRGYVSIGKELEIPESDAKKIVSRFFAQHASFSQWTDEQKRIIREKMEAESLFGRKRRLPAVRSNDKKIVAAAEREGVNFVIQSTASDVCAKALIRLWDRLKEEKLSAVPILTIHDSIMVECPDNEVEVVKNIMEEEMTRPTPGIDVPLGVDFKVGDRWR